ncbi:MAG: DUF853 family protein [Rhodobacteraceae bacterium]|nr:DUF853 family protein [Paracoccaceae bacterium]
MMDEDGFIMGGGGPGYHSPQHLLYRFANRHGLVAGATGTGKTVTMQVLAEGLSAAGVSVFMADVKGDVAGVAMPGDPGGRLHEAFMKRAETIGIPDFTYGAFPTVFWDIWGRQGHPIRATPMEMGPLLLARLLELNEAQEGVLNVAFRAADEEGLPILDMKDLQALMIWTAENARALSSRYGYVAPSTAAIIQRRLLVLEAQGGDLFFGEPALDLSDMIAADAQGRGRINLLVADGLINAPRLYATMLLWLLSELFETLPEVGNPDRPKLVFFFDEAHLLFNGAPRALVEKVEQVARLIRSKGVGVWFVTQSPGDLPATVLGQLGNRIQHALRAFTATDQRHLKLAAESYRPNPAFDTAEAIRDVGTGEAVVSLMEGRGSPAMVERVLIRPPQSRLGPITDGERATLMAASPLAGRYDTAIDRDSAHEMLARRAEAAAREAAQEGGAAANTGGGTDEREFNSARRYSPGGVRPARSFKTPARRGDSVADAFAKSFARQLGTRSGAAVARGVLGGLFRGR